MPVRPVPVEAIWPAELALGEGPLWHVASNRFFFVDIHGCAVHAWSPGTGARQTWKLPERIGWIIPRANGDGFIAGFQSGFAKLWLEPDLRIEPMGSPHPDSPDVRLNDAKADGYGRIWAGSMNNRAPAQADGQLVRMDTDTRFEVLEKSIHIANGPAIAQDGSWMLHNDSFLDTTYRYQLSPDGNISNKALWRTFTAKEGTPDGMTMDRDGNVWIAFWGGSCIRQFTPEGVLLQKIELPAAQITSMAFGGDGLDLLLVTSARVGLSAQALESSPMAGSVFLLRPGVKGLAPCLFGSV